MFLGEFQHSIDDKGRLTIPSKFRDALAPSFIITRGLDHCLFVFTMDEWHIFEQKLKALPMGKPEVRAFSRMFFSGATECELDKQGRVNIPAVLINHAGLEKDCTVIGAGNKVEIWNKAQWEIYYTKSQESLDDYAETIGEFF